MPWGGLASVQTGAEDAGQRALPAAGRRRQDPHMTTTTVMALTPQIIGGPTLIPAPREGETYRFKVQDGRAEKHVYVQIAAMLRAESFEEPLRSAIETKGESVLLRLLARNNVLTRIKL